MSRFAIRTPYFIVVVALIIAVVGGTALVRMPVDMFPNINIPMVVVATFYNGMPPEQIETDITSRFERQFTLASGIEHIESRSLPGASVIRVYFQPGTNSDSAVATISNLAMAQLRRLPPRHIASGSAEVRRFQPPGLPGYCRGRRVQRNAVARRRGELILERYFHGARVTGLADVKSASKSAWVEDKTIGRRAREHEKGSHRSHP